MMNGSPGDVERPLRRALAVVLLVALASGCSCSSSSPQREQPRALDRLNWSERNHRVLNQLVADHGRGGRYRDEARPGYIVLDWDSTTAQFDVQETVLRFQATHLRYKLTKDQFRALLPDSVNGVTRLSQASGSILLADIHADLASDYAFLYDGYSGLGGSASLEAVLATPQFQDFFAKLAFLYDGYIETPGIGAEYAFPWVMYLLAGHTTAEVKALARQAISHELGSELARVALRSPAGLSTRAGVVECSYSAGLRVIPEMQDLISTFQANGVDVFIVSASFKPIVETFGAPGNFGYSVPPENVIAMELAIDGNGVLLPAYKPGWVRTYRQGKVEAIDRAIKTGLGKAWDPLFAAGDSDGDYEMLTAFPGMKLSLVWNRAKGGDIGRLSRQAVEEQAVAAPRYILQGRDENSGVSLPGRDSVLLGKTAPQLLAP
jgi:phosphoserine phosphatase